MLTWLSNQDISRVPLVLETPDGTDSKDFFCRLLQKHAETSEDISIAHFCSLGGKNTLYYQVMFKIMTLLRIRLNLRQKVELVEENIRKYFSYWLNLASQKIK